MRVIGLLLAGFIWLAAPGAQAAQYYTVRLTGALVKELSESSDTNTGVDPNLSLGSVFTLTARFDASRAVEWGPFGYKVVGLYGMPTTGDEFWRIDAEGMTWKSRDHMLDYDPFYSYDYYVETPTGLDSVEFELAFPAIMFADGKVVGVAGWMSEAEGSSRPVMKLGSDPGEGWAAWSNDYPGGPVEYQSQFTQGKLSAVFTVRAGDGIYNNMYNSQGFDGVWDFAGSRAAIPEPEEWALLTLGFALSGAVLRSHRRRLRAA